jgi:hypothetical protein
VLRTRTSELQDFWSFLTGFARKHRQFAVWVCSKLWTKPSLGKVACSNEASTLKHTLKHSTLKHSTLKHSTLKYSTLKHSTLKYSTLKHSTLGASTLEASGTAHRMCTQGNPRSWTTSDSWWGSEMRTSRSIFSGGQFRPPSQSSANLPTHRIGLGWPKPVQLLLKRADVGPSTRFRLAWRHGYRIDMHDTPGVEAGSLASGCFTCATMSDCGCLWLQQGHTRNQRQMLRRAAKLLHPCLITFALL